MSSTNELYAEGLGFRAGTANQASKTVLAGKVRKLPRQPLPPQDTASFLNGEYQTCETLEPLVFYRVYGCGYSGAGAGPKGRFVTTEYAESKIDVKLRLALKLEWKNARMVEARLVVPAGTVIQVGIVAPQTLPTGTVLEGGADQIMLPAGWPDEWITGYRLLRFHPQLTYPEYRPEEPPAQMPKPRREENASEA